MIAGTFTCVFDPAVLATEAFAIRPAQSGRRIDAETGQVDLSAIVSIFMVDLPPNLAQNVASAIVRQAEQAQKLEQAGKARVERERQRRKQAMRDAAATKRQPGTSR